jgi:hypothetical protein
MKLLLYVVYIVDFGIRVVELPWLEVVLMNGSMGIDGLGKPGLLLTHMSFILE